MEGSVNGTVLRGDSRDGGILADVTKQDSCRRQVRGIRYPGWRGSFETDLAGLLLKLG